MKRGYVATTRHTVFMLFNGKMIKTAEPKRPTYNNFVICCDYGDWSGFRTLAECQAQFAELEQMAKTDGRGNGYYWVEER